MLYYRYRPASELSLKELLYSEIYFGSTAENNDPYDGKPFYFFGKEEDKWFRLLECAWRPITHIDWTQWAKALAALLAQHSPMTFQEALAFDYIRALRAFPQPPNELDVVGLTLLVRNYIDLYRPEESHFASFSKVNNNHLMWAHYASKYQGYCLIFRAIDGKLRQNSQLKRGGVSRSTRKGLAPHMSMSVPEAFEFEDVTYSSKPSAGDAFMRFPGHVSAISLSEPERISLVSAQKNQYLEKHETWSYEQEVRLLLTAPHSWLFGEHISFTKYERLFHYQPSQLVGIITGPQMREEFKKYIYEIISDRMKHSDFIPEDAQTEVFDFVIFEAELSNTSRDIVVKPTRLLSLSDEIDRDNSGFDRRYKAWQDGWAIVFDGPGRASKRQIL